MGTRCFLVLGVVALLLYGCSLAPADVRPTVDMPGAWRAEGTGPSVSGTSVVEATWWQRFGSPELDALVKQALAQNQNLAASVERIVQARGSFRVATAGLLPTASFSASRSENLSDPNTVDHRAATGNLAVAYEADLFGANRSSRKAAWESLRAAELDTRTLRTATEAEVAQGYFQLLALRERLRLAESNLKLATDTLGIVLAKYQAGTVSIVELSQQESAVASSRAALESLRQQEAAAQSALALLLGKAPANLSVSATSLAGMTLPDISSTQPSRLLEQRPDIAAAEARLRAANANIGVARAAFFPTLQLGLDNTLTFDPATQTASLSASALAPIFQGGRLTGNLMTSKARQRELVATYRQTVLTAFKEMEDALAGLRSARERREQLAIAADAARTAFTMAQERYRVGSIDFQTLLDTQRSLNSADDAFAQGEFELLNAVVTLVRVSGGGEWKSRRVEE